MFGKKKKPVQESPVKELEAEIKELRKERDKLREDVAELKLKKKIEDEDIKHMIKMMEERNSVKEQQFKLTTEREKDAEIAKIKDAYRDKLETFLQGQVKDTKDMYNQILQRLPDVNVRLRGDISGDR